MKLAVKAMKSSVAASGVEANILYTMEIGGAKKSCSMKITLDKEGI